ncbi:reverse transcriptase domain-containing protein [Brevibacillus sp. 179-C9.3 HS]|uniref:reverse transcriptase domain-containing protein n=1 Tax=unclassified Brevibacillus TaxID=2684853 RepID=UPI00399F42E4
MTHFNASPTLKASNAQLVKSLRSLQTFDDVANMLEITPKHLHYILFKKKASHYYRSFNIPKKNGGSRKICAPGKPLKILQEKLNKIFSLDYKPDVSAHGFINNRGILTNATKHLRKKYVLNIDIEDFFNSINFGRVRGVLKAFFGMSEAAATTIANICCYNNVLPQGAPTSPILSNMVCFKLDKDMRDLAKQYGCDYSRYADDLTFSTTRNVFPHAIAHLESGVVQFGPKLMSILMTNGFTIKSNKTRLHSNLQNLSVTGITVNKKPNVERNYVKKIRAILRCVETNPLSTAQQIYESKLPAETRGKTKNIMHVVRGMITHVGYVKGKQDPIYEKLAHRYNHLAGSKSLKVGEAFLNYWHENVCVVELGYIDNGIFLPEVQGTGFFLKDVGFVTNEHTFKDLIPDAIDVIQIHLSRYGKTSFNAQIKIINKDRDIAILEVDEYKPVGFQYDFVHFISQNIKVLGYPHHGHEDSLHVVPGVITQYRSHPMPHTFNKETGTIGVMQQRIVTNARIVQGNSGGPVINMNGQVIGIATKGFRAISESQKDDPSAENHIVPISEVFSMLIENELQNKEPSLKASAR